MFSRVAFILLVAGALSAGRGGKDTKPAPQPPKQSSPVAWYDGLWEDDWEWEDDEDVILYAGAVNAGLPQG